MYNILGLVYKDTIIEIRSLSTSVHLTPVRVGISHQYWCASNTNTGVPLTLMDWNTNPALLDETFTTETTYDALNRPVNIVNPDNTTLHYAYDKGGLLDFVQRGNNEVHISNIEYNEKGQRLAVYYGNNTKTKYEYNPLNFRLTPFP